MGLYDFTLYDVIARNGRIYANRPAFMDPLHNRSLTFSQVREHVDDLALRLQSLGCRKGDRIGVMGKNCVEFFLLYGAAAALGAIILPVNWRLSVEEAAYVLNDAVPKWVFADNDSPEWVEQTRAKLDHKPPFFNLLAGQGPFEEIDSVSAGGGRFTRPPVSADDGFVIIHTAAVYGQPRGALVSQNNLLCAHMHLFHGIGLNADDVHLNVLPMFHVAGLFMAFSAFHAGCLNISVPKFDAAQVVDLIVNHKVSVMFTFAPILKSILEKQKETGADISALRAAMGLEAPDDITAYQQVSGGTFYVMYGQTETSMLASLGAYNECPGSAGRPIDLGDVALLNDARQPVETGQVGEIVMRGPMVFKGYWGLEEDTAQTFRDEWHHTGDLGRMDENGYLWYAGRKADKELIKPGGENVYPAEVEKAVLKHSAVEAVVVFGVPDPKWKEGIKAVCQMKAGESLTAEDLIAFVGSRIARYKKPQYVEFVSALPTLDNGEIDREKVKSMYAQG
jgi:long-chain acyl-CoA synthetase